MCHVKLIADQMKKKNICEANLEVPYAILLILLTMAVGLGFI